MSVTADDLALLRHETQEAIARVAQDLRETERFLVGRQDEKEKQLRAEFVAAIHESETRTHTRFDSVDDHLTRQDTYIMRRRFQWRTWRRDVSGFAVATLIATLVLYFGFHVR